MKIITVINDLTEAIGIPEVIQPLVPFLIIVLLLTVGALLLFQVLYQKRIFNRATRSFYSLPWPMYALLPLVITIIAWGITRFTVLAFLKEKFRCA